MTSLDKLAKMDGWDVGEGDTDDGSIDRTVPAAVGQQFTLSDDADKLGERAHEISAVILGSSDNSKQQTPRNDELLPSDQGETQPKADVTGERRQDGDQNLDKGDTSSSSSSSSNSSSSSGRNNAPEAVEAPLSARLELPCQERTQAVTTTGKINPDKGGIVADKLLNTHPAAGKKHLTRAVAEAARPEQSLRTAGKQAWGLSERHPFDTLRERGFGSASGGTITGGGANTADDSSAIIMTLKTSLRKAQEESARERERCQVCEDQTRMAYMSLEAESKRAFELDNRVRVAEMRISLTSDNPDGRRWDGGGGGAYRDGGGLRGGVSATIHSRERKARSLSPVTRGRRGARAAVNAEAADMHARMAVIADATGMAREEAQSALDTVEGFAALNRKLVDELRTAVGTRDNLLEDLRMERGFREQLEGDVEELLGSGLVAEFEQKKEELEARCKKEQEETARVEAVHARMEEEYRVALTSSDRERARLEDAIASLEGELKDERRMQAVRAKEDAERAAMSSEEVRSILAGFHPRTKRRGNDRINLRQFNGRVADSGGSGGSGGRRPGSAQDHTKAEKNTARHVAAHHKNTSHGGPGPHKQRNNANVVTAGGNGGRSTNHHSPVSKGGGGGGGSSIGTGGMGKGDGSVGHAVHLAAVESVESFLGDFVPEVRAESPAVVAVLSASTGLETDGNGGVDGHDGGDGAVPKKVSKWAAIGRGGKMSARATAVCVEEATKAAEAEALRHLRSLTNASARVLSASWFSLLGSANAGTSAHGGHGHGSDGLTDEHTGGGAEGVVSVDATVLGIAVRRFVRSCGILQGTAGAPTLAHADMELQRNAVGKGGRSVGHRGYFKVIIALAQSRFAGERKDDALEKLSRMLRPAQAGPGPVPHAQKLETPEKVGGAPNPVATMTAKPSPRRAETAANATANATSLVGQALEEGLSGAERVLERDRRALEVIFSHYSTSSAAGPDSSGSLLPFAALSSFCKDFELTPGLISRGNAHRIYVQLAYPNETQLTPKVIAAREAPQGRRSAEASGRNGSGAQGATAAAGLGLGLGQWMTWLGLAAVGCTWFDKQRGLYNTPTKKVLGLLQWMEGSVGKKRISSKRGTAIVPAFNLLPLQETHARR